MNVINEPVGEQIIREERDAPLMIKGNALPEPPIANSYLSRYLLLENMVLVIYFPKASRVSTEIFPNSNLFAYDFAGHLIWRAEPATPEGVRVNQTSYTYMYLEDKEHIVAHTWGDKARRWTSPRRSRGRLNLRLPKSPGSDD